MPPQPNPILNLVPIIAVFAIFYFLLIRPQQKQAKTREKMLANLNRGDKILTSGGLYGTIVGIKGEDIEVKFSETVKLLVARSAVAKLVNPTEAASASNAAANNPGAPIS